MSEPRGDYPLAAEWVKQFNEKWAEEVAKETAADSPAQRFLDRWLGRKRWRGAMELLLLLAFIAAAIGLFSYAVMWACQTYCWLTGEPQL